MPAWQRLPMAIGGLMLILPETITDVTGIAIVAFFCLLNILQAKREKITAPA